MPSTKKTWRDSLPIDMLLSALSVLVVVQSSSEIPEGLMNNRVLVNHYTSTWGCPLQIVQVPLVNKFVYSDCVVTL
jgi:hypothetical protein